MTSKHTAQLIQSRIRIKETQKAMVLVEMPDLLRNELIKMRRNPAEFTVKSGEKCKFCYKRTAFALSPTGSWCPEHGWLHFDSVGFPPTERLSSSEIAERREAVMRKRGPRK